MTDEEILKQIIEIEPGRYFWNPLISWNDCGPLLEKYTVDTIWDWGENEYRVVFWKESDDISTMTTVATVHDPDLKRAICLAIIEAHRD